MSLDLDVEDERREEAIRTRRYESVEERGNHRCLRDFTRSKGWNGEKKLKRPGSYSGMPASSTCEENGRHIRDTMSKAAPTTPPATSSTSSTKKATAFHRTSNSVALMRLTQAISWGEGHPGHENTFSDMLSSAGKGMGMQMQKGHGRIGSMGSFAGKLRKMRTSTGQIQMHSERSLLLKDLDVVRRYVPDLLINFLAQKPDVAAGVTPHASDSCEAVCVSLDISGFSALSEQLGQKGEDGINELTEVTNSCMGGLMNLVYFFGGDVIKLAGDALYCAFVNPSGGGLRQSMVIQAVQCALAVSETARQGLSVHAGIGAGKMHMAVLGSECGRSEFIVSGEPMKQVCTALEQAKGRQVVLHKVCYEMISDLVTGDVLPSGHFLVEAVLPTRSCEQANPDLSEEIKMIRRNTSVARDNLPASQTPSIRRFVPAPVLKNMRAGGLYCMAELREVSTMFIRWDGYSHDLYRDLGMLGPYYEVSLRVISNYKGFLRQFLVDDKGCVMIACWGVPSASFHDNPVRCIQAALSCHTQLAQLGMPNSIGATTGRTLCSNIGSKLRCSYAIVGDDVNLAARLMMAAQGSVFCDRTTWKHVVNSSALAGKATFHPQPALKVKGKKCLVKPMKAVAAAGAFSSGSVMMGGSGHELLRGGGSGSGRRVSSGAKSPSQFALNGLLSPGPENAKRSLKMIGRSELTAFSIKLLEGLPSRSKPFFLVVEGVSGMGKTATLKFIQYTARTRLVGSGLRPKVVLQNLEKCNERHLPYSGMRGVFWALLGLHNCQDVRAAHSLLINLLDRAMADGGVTREVLVTTLRAVLIGNTATTLPSLGASGLASSKGSPRAAVECALEQLAGGVSVAAGFPPAGGVLLEAAKSGNIRGPWPGQRRASTGDMAGSSLREATTSIEDMQRALCLFLTLGVGGQPSVICLDNSHLMDNFTWRFLFQVAKQTGQAQHAPCIFVLTSQPMDERRWSFASNNQQSTITLDKPVRRKARHFFRLLQLPEVCKRFELSRFTHDEISNSLISLGVLQGPGITLKDKIVDRILELSGGNPFWVSEIISDIREMSLQTFMDAMDKVERTVATSEPDATNGTEASTDDWRLGTVIVQRLERLSVIHQSVAKHASVVGDMVPRKLLVAVLPKGLVEHAAHALAGLVQHRFLSLVDATTPDLEVAGAITKPVKGPTPEEEVYRFNHPLVRQALYRLTSSNDRRQIHAAVAQYLEAAPDKTSPDYSLVATHYQLSEGDLCKVVECSTKAAAQALVAGNWDDVLENLDRATREARFSPEIFEIHTVVISCQEVLHTTPAKSKSRKHLRRYSEISQAPRKKELDHFLLRRSTSIKEGQDCPHASIANTQADPVNGTAPGPRGTTQCEQVPMIELTRDQLEEELHKRALCLAKKNADLRKEQEGKEDQSGSICPSLINWTAFTVLEQLEQIGGADKRGDEDDMVSSVVVRRRSRSMTPKRSKHASKGRLRAETLSPTRGSRGRLESAEFLASAKRASLQDKRPTGSWISSALTKKGTARVSRGLVRSRKHQSQRDLMSDGLAISLPPGTQGKRVRGRAHGRSTLGSRNKSQTRADNISCESAASSKRLLKSWLQVKMPQLPPTMESPPSQDPRAMAPLRKASSCSAYIGSVEGGAASASYDDLQTCVRGSLSERTPERRGSSPLPVRRSSLLLSFSGSMGSSSNKLLESMGSSTARLKESFSNNSSAGKRRIAKLWSQAPTLPRSSHGGGSGKGLNPATPLKSQQDSSPSSTAKTPLGTPAGSSRRVSISSFWKHSLPRSTSDLSYSTRKKKHARCPISEHGTAWCPKDGRYGENLGNLAYSTEEEEMKGNSERGDTDAEVDDLENAETPVKALGGGDLKTLKVKKTRQLKMFTGTKGRDGKQGWWKSKPGKSQFTHRRAHTDGR